MTLEVPPSRVPQGGRSPWVVLVVALVGLLSFVGFVIAGKAPAAPVSPSSPPAALAAPSPTLPPTPSPRLVPSPTVTPEAAALTPSPACVPPRIEALGGPIARHPRALTPTGFETLTPWTGAEGTLVADRTAGFWALGSGRLTRLDAGGTMTASWTFADDALFGGGGVVPAREGGVWLWNGRTIAWFDGQRFRDVITAPGDILTVVEATDGSLWAVTGGRVFHWDGRSWSDIDCRPTPVGIEHLAIDVRGRLWGFSSNVAYRDGTTWSVPPQPVWDGFATSCGWGGISGFVAAHDGSVWLVCGTVARFDGTSWTSVRPEGGDLSDISSLAVAPDGTVWAATGSVKLPGDTDPHTGVASFDGRSWRVYDQAQGLPAPELSNPTMVTAVAASPDGVVAATREGFYRLAGDRWVRVGPRPAETALASADKLLAISSGEAWAAGVDAGLWHFRDGSWTNVAVAGWKSPLRVFDLARSPDGTLAVATDKGAAVLRNGRWTVLGKREAHGVTVARDGAIWVAEQASDSAETTVASFRLDGRTWVRTVLPSMATPGWARVALGPDGQPWVGSGDYGGLHRFDGRSWMAVYPPIGSAMVNVTDLTVAPNGALWLALDVGRSSPGGWAFARYDGATWTVWGSRDILPASTPPWSFDDPIGTRLAFAPDGSLWAATDQGLVRFDGRLWSLRFGGYSLRAISFAPDGTMWVLGPLSVQRLPAGQLVRPELSAP